MILGWGKPLREETFFIQVRKIYHFNCYNFCYFESSISEIYLFNLLLGGKISNLFPVNLSAALWWSNYGGHCPELQKLATRILSQTCDGASRYKLKRSLAENLLAKGRIPIGQERLCDLTFVHYNLHLRNADWSTDTDHEFGEIDPMNDWIVWEGPSTSQSNVEPRYDKHD